MRVLCCHTGRIDISGGFDVNQHGLYPSAAQALSLHAPQVELVDVSGDPYAYWREITARWHGRSDLIVVEQDVEITAGVLPQFGACSSPWCTFGYTYWRTWPPSFDACGCARYSARLQREFPVEVFEAAWEFSCGECCLPGTVPGTRRPPRPGCWRHIDAVFLAVFRAAGLKQSCRHEPLLAHRKEAALASQRA
jgi:hypothetical protein